MNIKDIGKLMKAQSELKSIQKKLKKIEITSESRDGMIKVTVNGESEVVSITIDEEKSKNAGIKALERSLAETVNRALADAKEHSSKEMMKMSSEMDLFSMAGELKKFLK